MLEDKKNSFNGFLMFSQFSQLASSGDVSNI